MQVAIDDVRARLAAAARAMGFPPRPAQIVADHLVDAELRGASDHGVGRIRWIGTLTGMDPAAEPVRTGGDEGLARWDAAGTIGYVALAQVLEAELSRPPAGARVVVVAHCHPTGRLGHHAERVAAAGLVCLLCATSPARIAHPQGGAAVTGTNPLCLAVPGEPPAVIDVSMGRITNGAVLAAARRGEPLPAGAALHADGSPARDPAAVADGTAAILPFGGDQAYKGFALAALVELLGSALAGEDGPAAVAVLAQPQAAPAEAFRAALQGRRMPGDASAARAADAQRRGTMEVPDDLWSWLTR